MTRLAYNACITTLSTQLTASAGDTTINLATALKEGGVTNIPTIVAPDIVVLACGLEIMHLTAYTAGATSGTVLRAQEGTAVAVHAVGAKVFSAPTKTDFGLDEAVTELSVGTNLYLHSVCK